MTTNRNDELDIPSELQDEPPSNGASKESKKGPVIITDLPEEQPPSGQQYFIFNMVSPVDPDQKCDVHAYRMLAVCKTKEEAARRAAEYAAKDSRFNIYQHKFGQFVPWVFDPSLIMDGDAQEKEMRSLLNAQQDAQQEAEDHFYDRIRNEKIAAQQARFAQEQKKAQRAGGEGEDDEVEDTRGNAISAKYNIHQLTNVCRKRLEELKFWKARYLADFSDEERKTADAYEYPPDAEVAPMFVV